MNAARKVARATSMALLVSCATVWWLWTSKEPNNQPVASVASSPARVPAPEREKPELADERTAAEITLASIPTLTKDRENQTLTSGEIGSASLMTSRLKKIRREEGIELSDIEIQRLSVAFALLQTEKSRIEVSLASVSERSADSLTFEVPPYPAEGKVLRAEWTAFLQEVLDDTRAAALDDATDKHLMPFFSCFGGATQTYVVRAKRDNSGRTQYRGTHEMIASGEYAGWALQTPGMYTGGYGSFTVNREHMNGGAYAVLLPFVEGLVPAN